MKTVFQSSFAKGLRTIKNRRVHDQVAELIETVEQAADLSAIPKLKKLHSARLCYRVRLGEYRVGIVVQEGVVYFVRCLHRKEIYRYFP